MPISRLAFVRSNYKLGVPILGSRPQVGRRRARDATGLVKPDRTQLRAPRGSDTGARRQDNPKGRPGQDSAAPPGVEPGPESAPDCTWGAGWEALEVYTSCLACLAFVFVLRSAVCYMIQHCRGQDVPDALLFPAWEVVAHPPPSSFLLVTLLSCCGLLLACSSIRTPRFSNSRV